MRTPTEQDLEQFVRREIGHCVSALISTLARNAGTMTPADDDQREMLALCDHAFEICSPIEDWEEAARAEGWGRHLGGGFIRHQEGEDDAELYDAEDWRELCEAFSVDPYEREIFEHWIVSDWLAEKLEQEGERVDRDFAGLCIWGRTTTGQGIAQDGVIARIGQKTIGA